VELYKNHDLLGCEPNDDKSGLNAFASISAFSLPSFLLYLPYENLFNAHIFKDSDNHFFAVDSASDFGRFTSAEGYGLCFTGGQGSFQQLSHSNAG
jgi:hypothetical protein